uniref:Pyruvate formate-lyase activating enzyme n=1 Tax=Chlamydomonas reinhardtii TaxID=3055 RepID=Q1RS82_CHLRE|nr:pyruvate formate-lyase activating enzyme [Chlamydomonas reinhardtii]
MNAASMSCAATGLQRSGPLAMNAATTSRTGPASGLPKHSWGASARRAFVAPATISERLQRKLSTNYSVVLPQYEPTDPSGIPEVFGNVHSTESMSAVDGPGVRFLVFVQGCAMRCLFCSNPGTWTLKGGNKTSSKEIAADIKRVRNYLKPRGGITISGGEAMLQPHFVSTVFQEVHALGLNTTVDTTGQGTKAGNWDVVLPHTDLVLFCIKHIDPIKYEALTGMKQRGASGFADQLAERKIPFYLRYVYIPGYTDGVKDIDKLIEWCKQQPTFQGIELLPYHVLGRNKWEVMGLPYPLDGTNTPPHEQVRAVIKVFNDNDVPVICAE